MHNLKGKKGCLLFDWGNTLMKDLPQFNGPMYMWPKVEAIPNAEKALVKLKEGWFIALATNAKDSTKEDIKRAFDRVNLLQYLDEIYCFRTVGYLKPTKEFFEYILNDLGIDKSYLVMIGDDLKSDIQGANDFGIVAIWINSETDTIVNTKFCKTINHLNELPECIDQLDIPAR